MLKSAQSFYFSKKLKVSICLFGLARNNDDTIIEMLTSFTSYSSSLKISLDINILSWCYEIDRLKRIMPRNIQRDVNFIHCGIEPPILDYEYRDYRSAQNQFKQLIIALNAANEKNSDFIIKLRLDDSKLTTLSVDFIENIIDFLWRHNKSFTPYASYSHPFWWDDRFFILNREDMINTLMNLGTKLLTTCSWNYFPEYILWSTIASRRMAPKSLKVIDSIDWRMMYTLRRIYPKQRILGSALKDYCNFVKTYMCFTSDLEKLFQCPELIAEKSNDLFPGRMGNDFIVERYSSLNKRLQQLCQPYGPKKISRFFDFNSFINKCIVSNEYEQIINCELPHEYKNDFWQESSILKTAKGIYKFKCSDFSECLKLMQEIIDSSPTSFKWTNIIFSHTFACMHYLGLKKDNFDLKKIPINIPKGTLEVYERLP